MNPCIYETCKSGAHNRYYPLELVEIIDDETDENTKEIGKENPINIEYDDEYAYNNRFYLGESSEYSLW